MFRSIRLEKLLLCLLILVAVFAGCSSSTEITSKKSNESESTSSTQGEKVLKVALPAAAGNLDPHFTAQHSEWEITQPIFNGLVRFKPGTASFETIEGDLAENWDVSDDGLTLTFHLRKGVQWHKGYGELTSEDVKWSYERVLDPKVGSSHAASLKFLDKIEVPDKYTVVFKLKKPNPSFISNLIVDGPGAGAIVKKEAIESGGDDAAKLIGTGPFMLESYTPGESVVLEKNEDYFRGSPKLDRIEYFIMKDLTAREVAMDKGEIHMTYGEPDQLWVDKRRAVKGIEIDISGLSMIWNLQISSTVKPLDDIRIRQAIAHAIDYKSYMKSLGELARPATSVLSDKVYGYANVGQYEYNPKKSKELLAEAGYPNGLKLPEILTPNLPAYVPMNTFIQEQLRQVGIEAPMNQVDLPTWITALYSRQNPINLTISGQNFHAAVPLYRSYHSKGPANYTGYTRSDELIEQIEIELDENKALELMEKVQKEVLEEYVTIPLFETLQTNARRAEVDLGYELKDTRINMSPKYETTDLKE